MKQTEARSYADCKCKIADRYSQKRENSNKSIVSDNIRHFCQVIHGNISDNGCGFNRENDFLGIEREEKIHGLGEYDFEKRLAFAVPQGVGSLALPDIDGIHGPGEILLHKRGKNAGKTDDRNKRTADSAAAENRVIEQHQKDQYRRSVQDKGRDAADAFKDSGHPVDIRLFSEEYCESQNGAEDHRQGTDQQGGQQTGKNQLPAVLLDDRSVKGSGNF